MPDLVSERDIFTDIRPFLSDLDRAVIARMDGDAPPEHRPAARRAYARIAVSVLLVALLMAALVVALFVGGA